MIAKSCFSLFPCLCLLMAVSLSSCRPTGFQDRRPNLTNEGLNSAFPDQEPAFSGDGRYIVFSSARGGHQAVYLYDQVQGGLVDLPGLNANDVATSSPDISAEGRYIVYISNALGKSDVFLYDRETKIIQNISARIPGDVRHPTISGDGRYIAFESNGLGQWHIEVFDRGSGILTVPSPSPS